jgi:hypothetical protein
MNTDRTNAYSRVVKTLDDIGATKLQPAELDRIREAADTLIFATSPEEAGPALQDIGELCEHLVAVDRWTEERAEQLLSDLQDCGPFAPVG